MLITVQLVTSPPLTTEERPTALPILCAWTTGSQAKQTSCETSGRTGGSSFSPSSSRSDPSVQDPGSYMIPVRGRGAARVSCTTLAHARWLAPREGMSGRVVAARAGDGALRCSCYQICGHCARFAHAWSLGTCGSRARVPNRRSITGGTTATESRRTFQWTTALRLGVGASDLCDVVWRTGTEEE